MGIRLTSKSEYCISPLATFSFIVVKDACAFNCGSIAHAVAPYCEMAKYESLAPRVTIRGGPDVQPLGLSQPNKAVCNPCGILSHSIRSLLQATKLPFGPSVTRKLSSPIVMPFIHSISRGLRSSPHTDQGCRSVGELTVSLEATYSMIGFRLHFHTI
jgi:hypothetical protein